MKRILLSLLFFILAALFIIICKAYNETDGTGALVLAFLGVCCLFCDD